MADFIIKSAAGTGNKTLIQGQDQSGSAYAIQIGDAGATTLTNATITAGTFPAGHVLQVVMGDVETGAVTSSSATHATTDLEVAITPSSTSSKILIMLSQTFDTQASERAVEFALYRDGSIVQDKLGYGYSRASSDGRVIGHFSSNYLHSPSTTSATTYQLYARSPGADTVYTRYSGFASTIVAMEIKG